MSMSNNHSSLISDIESSIPFNIETANQSQPLHEAVQSQLNTGNQLNAIDIALNAEQPITTWTKEQISEIYNTPLNDLLFFSQVQHRKYHNSGKIQLCTLLSIKTGGCSEDCSYCAQSSKHDTGLKAEKLIDVETVFQKAKEAKLNGSTRFCMGSAWRDMTGRKSALKKISTMVSRINNELGLETCVTLGMINKEQAKTLADAGLTAYNHNIDTSREHYPNVITTRSYDDRLNTIKTVQNTEKIKVCTGGILGLGETKEDHVSFLYTLSNMDQHPESLPINRLVPIKGTPIEKELSSGKLPKERKLTFEAILKVIATARLIMPKSIIRLAAGRYTMKESEQLLCFMTGCNAIFTGERMLTTMCSGWEDDIAMLSKWGFTPMKSFEKH
ncbi:hypothetical protein CANARDRAFT_22691 [[Candida] arabinofermentans NRRL YB-2248]|uniref:biotin synthase n=1 Tax=[Candida] arabinofermentans NRRL YB-2248 TaxID=983967 RepID=A0A1E4T2D2_9ASCO|nr:hypothetical protein CANARDRAFT_22691 [[Candida] arabinofermentans NRRL YB-2248]